MTDFIKINDGDNVIVALKDIAQNQIIEIDGLKIVIKQDIKLGHKIAIKNINQNCQVIKYGYPIGYATVDIAIGQHVHSHNLKTLLNDKITYQYNPITTNLPKLDQDYFQGYRRKNNQVGIRNEIWIIPTVGCVNSIVKAIEQQSQILKTNNIDAIIAYNHPFGCSQSGDDQIMTQKILSGLCQHPNAVGVLLVGLGCENSGIEQVMSYIENIEDLNIETLICQQVEDEITQGIAKVKQLIVQAGDCQREAIDISELIVGLKCGGSDGLSGISANPLVGEFSDILIKHGGTSVLTEVPEMFGAEQILMNRCINQQVYQNTVCLINDFKDYYIKNQTVIYENPSPGNKAGGITTLEDKSLGCTQKSGHSSVMDVVKYGDRIWTKGLNLYQSPGNDLVAASALAAAGCHMVLFTTGRGTPFACPVPTVKISSNDQLYQYKNNWIDFNAGQVLIDNNLQQQGLNLYQYVRDVASGTKVKSEQCGYRDLAIFKTGIML